MTTYISKPSKELLIAAAELIMLLLQSHPDLEEAYLFGSVDILNTREFSSFYSLFTQTEELKSLSETTNVHYGVYFSVDPGKELGLGLSVMKQDGNDVKSAELIQDYCVRLPNLQTKHDVLAYIERISMP